MEKIRGKPVAKGGPLVKAIEPYGINFKVVLSNEKGNHESESGRRRELR